MPSVPWFKLWAKRIYSSPRCRSLKPNELQLWLHLMLISDLEEPRGYLQHGKRPWMLDEVLTELGYRDLRHTKTQRQAFERLLEVGLVERLGNGGFRIARFRTLQGLDEKDSKAEAAEAKVHRGPKPAAKGPRALERRGCARG